MGISEVANQAAESSSENGFRSFMGSVLNRIDMSFGGTFGGNGANGIPENIRKQMEEMRARHLKRVQGARGQQGSSSRVERQAERLTEGLGGIDTSKLSEDERKALLTRLAAVKKAIADLEAELDKKDSADE